MMKFYNWSKYITVDCLCLFRFIKSNKEYFYYIQHHALITITVYRVKHVPQVDCVNHYHALGMDSVPMEPVAIPTYVNVKVIYCSFYSGKAIMTLDFL